MVDTQQKDTKINEKTNKEEVITNDNSSQVLAKANYSAEEVAKYLLSLDPKNFFGFREYFTLRPISFGEEPDDIQTREGNFRLNKILHMCQIFHCMEYSVPLFRERMEAYENGAIIYKIRMNFIQLWSLPDKDLVTNINEKTKNFVSLVYNYFHDNYKHDNKKLRDFSHEDPAWHEGLKQEEGIMPLNERLITYYQNHFYDTLNEIKEREV